MSVSVCGRSSWREERWSERAPGLMSLARCFLVLALGGAVLFGLSGCVALEPSTYRPIFRGHIARKHSALAWLRLSAFSQTHKRKRRAAKSPPSKHPNGGSLQRHQVRCKGCTAVVSYRFQRTTQLLYHILGKHGRSYLYDNGLMLALLAMRGRCQVGAGLVEALEQLQNPDGSWGFSFDTWGNDFYNRSYIRAGSVAWAGYGLAMFAERCRSKRAQRLAVRAYRYLAKLRISRGTTPDLRVGLYRGGRGRWTNHERDFQPVYVMQVCVTEHQFDIYFFFKRLARLLKGERLAAQLEVQAEALARAIMRRLWMPKERRFARGVGRKALDPSLALDAAGAWGALFLLARGRRDLAKQTLAFVERRFFTRNQGFSGYRPYAGVTTDDPTVHWDEIHTLFLEGTASMAFAYLRIGRIHRASWLLVQLREAAKETGGVPYAIGARKDFPQIPAAASTLWYLFARMAQRGLPAIAGFWNER